MRLVATEFDGVLVVGAGPVGLVTALTLARAGVPVLVLEAGAGIAQAPRAIVYHSPTVEALDGLGVLEDMKAVGLIKADYQWRTVDGRILARIDMSVLRPGDTRYPYNLHLGQHVLAEVVLAHLRRMPGAEVRFEHRVTGLGQDENGGTVTAATPEGNVKIRARYVVGADGANSAIRPALGLDFPGRTWPEWFVATDIPYDFEAHGWARANFIVDPVNWGIVPKISDDPLWRLTYGEPGDLPREALRGRLAAKYAALLPDGKAVEPAAFSPYRVHNRCADRFRVGRVLLAGDAAHVTNPVGGLGLTGGLLDAVVLGAALALALREDGGEGDEALDGYAQERRRIFLEVVSPAASENKRRLMEADPAKRRADIERLKRLNDEPEFARETLLFTTKLAGEPIRK